MVGRARAEARYRITAEDRTERGLESARRGFRAFGRSALNSLRRVAFVGGAIATALGAAFIKATTDVARYGDELDKAALRTNTTAQEFAELRFVAERQGVSVRQLTRGLDTFNKRIGETLAGSAEFAQVFETLGLSAETLDTLGPARALGAVFDEINKIQSAARRADLIRDLFGGAAFGQIAALGGQGLARLRGEARANLGNQQRVAEAGAQFADATANLSAAFQGLKGEFTPAIRTLTQAVDTLTDVLRVAREEGVFGLVKGVVLGDLGRRAERIRLEQTLAMQDSARATRALAQALEQQNEFSRGLAVLSGN